MTARTETAPTRSRAHFAALYGVAAGLLMSGLFMTAAPMTAHATDQNGGFYVDPNSTPAIWVRDHPADSRTAQIRDAIATKPMARWFGNWSGNIGTAVATYVDAARAADKLPILVAYNIPGRDCGSHSGGGAGSPEAYRTWISSFASGIGSRRAVVVVEPDALAQLDCLSTDLRNERVALLQYAARELRARAPNARVYHDGGNSHWIAADEMARRLHSAGVRDLRGFALNVSNYHLTADANAYGNAVSASLRTQFGYNKPFVVDTSRNGNGSNGEWCNPGGRKLGVVAQHSTSGAEMLLWIKVPGNSDGLCGIAPTTPAGTFTPELAMHLITGN